MDPQLFEEIARREPESEIDAVIRLIDGASPPPQVRIVSQFGDIATCRIRLGDIIDVRNHPSVRSLKASRRLNNDIEKPQKSYAVETSNGDRRRPRVRETGAGVIIGIVDYGCDFAYRTFLKRNGQSRIRYLWDQRAAPDSDRAPQPYGRGRLFTRRDINAALRDDDPYAALDYHPAPSSRPEGGSHGTHVLDIAAGNGRGSGPRGVAPQAEIIFVHVASGDISGTRNFGDSVGVLEAIDFINRMAGEKPTVINISMGRHGGPHDGSTLTERAIDHMLGSRHGLSLVQSAGNYYGQQIHCSGQLENGQSTTMSWNVLADNTRTKELEIWYSGDDQMIVRLYGPDGRSIIMLAPDSRREIIVGGEVVGRAYHRINDPGNGDTHIDIFLYDNAPDGEWELRLTGRRISDGQWHAWLERDGDSETQTRFQTGPIRNSVTTGTIAHARGPVQVAAHTGTIRSRTPTIARFSSAGPSRDGRTVPLVSAPGSRIWAARSAVPDRNSSHREIVRKSGTSMATPHITGLVALILQAHPRASQRQIRSILRRSAQRQMRRSVRGEIRDAWGTVDFVKALRVARRSSEQTDDFLAKRDMPAGETLDTETQQFVAAAEWPIVANWLFRRTVPTDGSGALPPNQSPLNAVTLPIMPADASRTVAQALLNFRTRSIGLMGPPTPLPNQSFLRHPGLDPLAIILLPAMPPSASEWAELGAFMEAQTNASRDGRTARNLFGTNADNNRRNMAHHLACLRLAAFPASTFTPIYCAYPQGTQLDPSIQILTELLARPGPLVDWAAVPIDQRRVHVMHRLITQYGYSRNAAAGIVGNLQAESGIIPERVEGAGSRTPRTAASMQGARRRHTTADIMNRSQRPPRGPRLPGVGLAQWTTRQRRQNFFAARFNGVRPGQYMLFFMNAQIAYLIAELRANYSGLERQLQTAGITRDQAADDFVYDFERPGAILEEDPNNPGQLRRRPRADAAVQAVFRTRRNFARLAAQAYERVHPIVAPAQDMIAGQLLQPNIYGGQFYGGGPGMENRGQSAWT